VSHLARRRPRRREASCSCSSIKAEAGPGAGLSGEGPPAPCWLPPLPMVNKLRALRGDTNAAGTAAPEPEFTPVPAVDTAVGGDV
jgi:hypothetical protein